MLWTSLFATREGERCTKEPVHPVRHPRFHPGERANAQTRESCARQNEQNGRGMAPCWAGATPLFRLSAAQKVRGVAPALIGTSGPRFARWHTQTENLSDKRSDNLYENERRNRCLY